MSPQQMLRVAESRVWVAQALLVCFNDDDQVERATHLLAGVEGALSTLASEAALDTERAAGLLGVRTDLSGHLLASAALQAAGASEARLALLRRAAATTLAGIRAISDDHPLVAGQR